MSVLSLEKGKESFVYLLLFRCVCVSVIWFLFWVEYVNLSSSKRKKNSLYAYMCELDSLVGHVAYSWEHVLVYEKHGTTYAL